MSYVRVDNGVNLPLTLQLGDGNTGKFPQARVYDSGGTLQATKSLTHLAGGLYTDSTFAPVSGTRYTAQYITYQDSGHTTEDVYPRTTDVFDVRDVGPLSTDYTAARAAKIDNLDVAVSTRLPTATFTATIGAPAGASVSADIAAVKSDTGTLTGRLTSTRAANLDNLDVAVSTRNSTAHLDAVLGAPAGASVSADIAAVKVDTAATRTTLGTPVGSSLSADIANVQTTDNAINTKLGTPAGATVSADIAAVKGDTATLTGRLTSTRAANLDYLDTAVSLVQTKALSASQTSAIEADVAGVLAAVQNIQNNTNFVGVVPAVMAIPDTGTTNYKFFANLYDDNNAPVDPDGSVLNYMVQDTGGSTLVSTTAMTRDSAGVYETTFPVASGTADTGIIVNFTYSVSAVAYTQRRTGQLSTSTSDLDTLLSRLTAQRAANLDYLDVAVTSRAAEANEVTRYNNILADGATTQAAVAGVQTKLGTPVAATVSLDINAVRLSTDKIGAPANGTLAADMAALQATENTVNTKLGTPAGATVSADIAAVKGDTGALVTRLTPTRANNLDYLDFPVSSVQSAATALAQFSTADGKLDSLLSGLGSVQSGSTFRISGAALVEVPDTGTRVYNFYGELVDAIGHPADADAAVSYVVKDAGGTTVISGTATELTTGHFKVAYAVAAGDTQQPLELTFSYVFDAVAQSHVHVFEVKRDEAKLDAVKAKTDQLPSDFSAVATGAEVAAQANYVNRMSTVFNNLTGLQEVMVWAEKNGQAASGTNASVAVYDDSNTVQWTAAAAVPDANGVFVFSHTFGPTADGNYYALVTITVDGQPRANKQPFVAVG